MTPEHERPSRREDTHARPAHRDRGPSRPGPVPGSRTPARGAEAGVGPAHDLGAVAILPPAAAERPGATGRGESSVAVRGRERRSFRLSVEVRRGDPPTGEREEAADGRAAVGADRDGSGGPAGERVVEEAFGGLRLEESDAISPTLSYAPTIRGEGSPGAGQFGVTTTSVAITGITVTPDAPSSSFRVAGDVRSTITWSVQSLGRTDIPSESAPAITHANYPTVASDLTPNMGSDGGRPPRTSFWARDLTEQHERFHAHERAQTYGRPAFEFAVAWLGAETAADAAAATALTRRVPAKMHESYAASYSPGKETRAYGDGAPSYTARATAVSAKGGRNEYPGAPPPPPAPAPAAPAPAPGP